ncbi:MAG: hypothetical protein R3C11_19530 [Planctomycetaceae bacterium]
MEAALAELPEVESLAQVQTPANFSITNNLFAQNMDAIDINNNGVAVMFEDQITVEAAPEIGDQLVALRCRTGDLKDRDGEPQVRGDDVEEAIVKSDTAAESNASVKEAQTPDKEQISKVERQLEVAASELKSTAPADAEPSSPSQSIVKSNVNSPTLVKENSRGLDKSAGDLKQQQVKPSYQVALTFPRSQLPRLWEGSGFVAGNGHIVMTEQETLYSHSNSIFADQPEKQEPSKPATASEAAPQVNNRVRMKTKAPPLATIAEQDSDSGKQASQTESRVEIVDSGPVKDLRSPNDSPIKKSISDEPRIQLGARVAPPAAPQRRQMTQYLFIFETAKPRRQPAPAERPGGEDSSWFIVPDRRDQLPS